ncbi:ras GTPase-activating protein nGAP-like isoform X3 [Centruroides vittatus]
MDKKIFTHYSVKELQLGDIRRSKLQKEHRLSTPITPSVREEVSEELAELIFPKSSVIRASESNSTKRHTIGITLPTSYSLDGSQDTSYEKNCPERRGSTPAVVNARNMDTPTPSRIVNFFAKRSFKSNPLKRTKSVTKLERKRCTIDGDSVPSSRLRPSRSHESLLQSSPSVLGSLDLSQGNVKVSALHPSILGQDNCFHLTADGSTRYYYCHTAAERDRWVKSLRGTIQPDQENMRRTEKSLHIWILEVKGVSPKKKYFCELCLDKTLYARTSSKPKSDMCFWGERFELNSLPELEMITVNLYREADKKKRRDKNVLLGYVNIPVSSVHSHHLVEKWYTLNMEKVSNNKDSPSIRIKSRFQVVDILPILLYKDFLQYLKTDYKILCEMLEPAIGVRTKEDIATTLINIMQKENMAKQFLTDAIMADVNKIDDQHLTFRGNSLATKAAEAFMKLLGEKYLQDTLGEVVRNIIESPEDCEVDPMKVCNNAVLQRQQSTLISFVEMTWAKVINSASYFPAELQDVFYKCRQSLAAIGKEELSDNLIGASIFLRFLCPAILSPSLFNLTQEYPQGRAARNLTLVAKTIQTLANFTKFGGKESFMEFMNDFVEKEWGTMKAFIRQISSQVTKEHENQLEFDGYIDLGKELSILHSLLNDCVLRINQKLYADQVDHLQHILDGVSAALTQPGVMRQMSSPAQGLLFDSPVTPIDYEPFSLFHQQSLPEEHLINNSGTKQASTSSQENGETIHSTSLQQNTFILGSGKLPAQDLSTADDYVLYSALNQNKEGRDNIPLRHGIDPSLRKDGCMRLAQSCFYGDILGNSFVSERLETPPSSPRSLAELSQDSAFNFSNLSMLHTAESPNGNSSAEGISCLSKLSRNLESFYTKSSPATPLPGPLAFNNPLYHFPHSSSPNKLDNEAKQSPCSSVGSNEDMSVMGKLCLGIAESTPELPYDRHCYTSSSSSDGFTPPRERRSTFKSTAPRTNPHFSSSQPSVASRSPMLNYNNNVQYQTNGHSSNIYPLQDNDFLKGVSSDSLLSEQQNVDEEWDSEPHTKIQTHNCKTLNKTLEEYEQQVEELRHLMEDLQDKLQGAEQKLTEQETATEQVVADWKARLEAGEERLRRQQEEKDHQMKNIITRLITVEDELRREQQELQDMIAAKQKVIDAQERKIQTLDAANTHLMSVLNQLKERYQLHSQNGILGSPPLVKMSLFENDLPFKSSSC